MCELIFWPYFKRKCYRKLFFVVPSLSATTLNTYDFFYNATFYKVLLNLSERQICSNVLASRGDGILKLESPFNIVSI